MILVPVSCEFHIILLYWNPRGNEIVNDDANREVNNTCLFGVDKVAMAIFLEIMDFPRVRELQAQLFPICCKGEPNFILITSTTNFYYCT